MYTNDPRNRTIDALRLLVGDVSTSTSAEYLSDVDYDYFASVTPTNYMAAQLAANSLAALFTGAAASAGANGYVEKTVGDLTLKKADATQLAKSYAALSQKFARMAVAGIAPYAGGITVSGKASVEQDADRVKPRFVGNLFDNPAALDAARPSTST